MIFGLRVNRQEKPNVEEGEELIFSWESDEERQFTVQMATDKNFQYTKMYLDTKNNYCIYHGCPLKTGRTYYWRIRSGVREWINSEFSIGAVSTE